jgi:class 3 adenylate cyclase
MNSVDLQGRFLQQLGDKPYNVIMLDTDGTLWLGGYHGLYSMTKGQMALEIDTASPWLKSNMIWALLEDRQGRIWVGTENGLVRRDSDNKWTYFDTTHGLPHQAVWSLVEHPTWGVLAGTDKGAARWTGQHFEAVPWDTPLIEFMAVDPQGRLWVGTGDGIYRVNQHQHIDLFLDKARGLPSNTSYINSVFVTDKAIYAGTYSGLVRIDLDIENDRNATPLLDVYQLDINGKASPISLLSQPLQYFNKNLTFRFNGIYMYLPESVTYRYYLEGFDQEWHEATTINQAVYTNLPPGDYTFHVQALAEGKKTSPVQQVAFRLLAPFWQTWWAYSLYLILGVAAVWGMTRIQVQRVRRKAELQLQEKQRQLQEKQRFLDASERFVPGEFLAYLHRESIVEVELGDCIEQTISILFSDIRSFTTISEHMKPEENFAFLNSYLGYMGPLIRNHRGFIDKYIGDAIMALFGQEADDAVQAGLAMLQELHAYNTTDKPVRVPITMGIGIHRGPMMLGTIGETHRLETTVISDAVNLASRLEGMTKIYGVSLLISEQLLESLHQPSRYATRIIDRVQAKGKHEPTTIYEVYNADPPELFDIKELTKKVFEEGILLYNVKDFTNAKSRFQECLAKNPADKAAALFLERCTHYIDVGWDEAWTDVTQLDTK